MKNSREFGIIKANWYLIVQDVRIPKIGLVLVCLGYFSISSEAFSFEKIAYIYALFLKISSNQLRFLSKFYQESILSSLFASMQSYLIISIQSSLLIDMQSYSIIAMLLYRISSMQCNSINLMQCNRIKISRDF